MPVYFSAARMTGIADTVPAPPSRHSGLLKAR